MLSAFQGLLQRGLLQPVVASGLAANLQRGVLQPVVARGLAATLEAFRAYSSQNASRALKYDEFGMPRDVLRLEENGSVKEPGEGQVLIRILAAPINPSDINTIQGKYPLRPEEFPAVPGHEGVGIVEAVGPKVESLKEGDMVIPMQHSQGTWRSHAVVDERHWARIPKDLPLATAATMVINPPTALQLLEEFVPLQEGDTVIQSGANSAVGKVIIQLAKSRGINTVNLIRDRPDRPQVEAELKGLGATLVTTQEELKRALDKSGLQAPKLALDCVAGDAALAVAKTLQESGTLVCYGGMSMQPISIPAPLLIFKDLRVRGFWLTGGFAKMKAGWRQKEDLVDRIVALYRQKAIKPPLVESVPMEQWREALDLYYTEKRNYKVLLTT